MKILYSKKRRKYELFQGIFWILLFVLGILFSDRKNVFFYFLAPLNLPQLLSYFYITLSELYPAYFSTASILASTFSVLIGTFPSISHSHAAAIEPSMLAITNDFVDIIAKVE